MVRKYVYNVIRNTYITSHCMFKSNITIMFQNYTMSFRQRVVLDENFKEDFPENVKGHSFSKIVIKIKLQCFPEKDRSFFF